MVVIVPGALVTLDTYLGLAQLLAPDYRVIVVERRGYGLSESGPRPVEFATQAADLAAVLTAVGEPAFVFGHSAGGLVTLEAMRRDPSMVRRLALYEPPLALAGSPLKPTLEQIRRHMEAGRPADAIIEFFTAITDPIPARAALQPLADALAFRAPGLVADLECLTAMDPDPASWRAIELPALLLVGEITDPYGISSIDLLQSTLPNSRTVTLPGQRHHPDDVDILAGALRDFFRSPRRNAHHTSTRRHPSSSRRMVKRTS
ncbi:alpha/beta fold hydrolase [Nocardia sp. CC227C]|uniref:alpha/beta fold hydrolase n=1 Tax=Nocardia sp. CC227C TaxID=3044562 RepID=UPI00278C6BB0|nr:alpha/beta hydrolase [Nocardia sp. CC227C]